MMRSAPAPGIVVLDVWFNPVAGTGQTVMKHLGTARRTELRNTAVTAARFEIALEAEAGEPVVAGRLRRGPRLPDGQRHAFVDWTIGRPTTRALQVIKRILK